MRIRQRPSLRRQPIGLMAEKHAHRPPRLPVEQVNRMHAGLNAGFEMCCQATVSSAPGAVFEIIFSGGLPVIPASQSFPRPTASAVRKKAPTLYRLRTFSSSTQAGSPGTSA